MMKIRYALLLSVSCLGLGSLAHAGLTPDITPVGKKTSIFTYTSNKTHLSSQSKLLSASVIARRTLSDAAIHNNINGSPRGLSSARDDDSDDFLSTHPNPLYQEREHQEQATASLPLIGKAGVEKQSSGLFFADRRRLVSLQRSDSDDSRRYNRVTDTSASAARRMSR